MALQMRIFFYNLTWNNDKIGFKNFCWPQFGQKNYTYIVIELSALSSSNQSILVLSHIKQIFYHFTLQIAPAKFDPG